MKIFATILSLLLFSFTANAGSVTAAGTVTLSGNGGHGVIIVVLDGSGNTSCGNGLRYWLKPDTDYNRSVLSLLLAAQMSGKRVYLTGAGACVNQYPYNDALFLSNITLMND